MKFSRVAHVCQIAGFAALVCGAVVFVVLVCREHTVDWETIPLQDLITFREMEAGWRVVAAAGALVGLALVCVGAAIKALAGKRAT